MEATSTRLKPDNTEKEENRLFLRGLFEVVYKLKEVFSFSVDNRHGEVNELGKDTHILKCVNCNHRFFDVCAVAGTGYREGGEN